MKIFVFIYFIYLLGFLYGFLSYFIIFYLFIKTIEKIYKLEFISGSDLLFLYEYDKSPNVIISNIIIQKIQYEKFKSHFIQNAIKNFPRLRQRVKKRMGEYYWEELNINSSIENIKEVDRKIFRSMCDILSYDEKLFVEHMDRNKPLWEVHFIEDFQSPEYENHSLIIFKFHHSLADGIGMLNLFTSLSENFELNTKTYSQFKQISNFKKVLLYLASPYYMVKAQPKKTKIKNPFQHFNRRASGIKKLAVTKAYEYTKFKQIYSKFPKATFNDLSWTLIVRSLLRWANEKNRKDEISYTGISGLMGISTRTSIKKHEMGNQSIGQLVTYDNIGDDKFSQDNFEKCLKIIQNSLVGLKDKNMIISANLILNILSSLLINETMMKKIGEDSFNNVSFIYTNVQGPPKKVYLKNINNRIDDMLIFVPHGNLVFSIVAFSYNGEVKFSFHSDRLNGPPVKELVEFLEKDIESLFEYYKI